MRVVVAVLAVAVAVLGFDAYRRHQQDSLSPDVIRSS